MKCIEKKYYLKNGFGITTNNYKAALNNQEITYTEILKSAAKEGFRWVELRDPDVKLSVEELSELKILADQLNLRIHYGWDNKNLFEEDKNFLLGMEHAVLFGKGTYCRVLIASDAVMGKKGYTRKEFDQACRMIRHYDKLAKEMGIVLCYENTQEPLHGDGVTYYGMQELFDQCPEMQSTLDVANFFNSRVIMIPTEPEVMEYISKNSKHLPYFHLKQTYQNRVMESIQEKADFDIVKICHILNERDDALVCLELPRQENLKEVERVIKDSIHIMKK